MYVRGSTSGPITAVPGVPKGSAVGLALFLLLNHDLTSGLYGEVIKFADAVKTVSPRSPGSGILR